MASKMEFTRPHPALRTKTVGMIRTNHFSRAIGVFPADSLRRFEATRSRKTKAEKDIYRDWISESIDEIRSYSVDWNYWEFGRPFEVEKVFTLMRERSLGEMTVEYAEFEFEDPRVIEALNGALKPKKRIVKIAEDTKLYALFRSNTRADVRSNPYIMALNAQATREHHLKYGALDLVQLMTERARKYGEKENIPVTEWPEVARLVLNNLDPEGWPREQREVMVNGSVCFPKPFALRNYEAASKKGWRMVGEEEV